MANPRRSSYTPTTQSHHQISISSSSDSNNNNNNNNNNSPFQTNSNALTTTLSSLRKFLKRPHAFPFLLSIFLFLTWVSLRFQRSTQQFNSSRPQLKWSSTTSTANGDDHHLANLVRFPSVFPSPITKDKRGWLLNPLPVAADAGISGGAVSCASIHVGEIRPGALRGNHRHHTCNETLLIWGATTVFRLENDAVDKGYAEVIVGADEVAVAASPSGKAHAMVNIDPVRSTFFLGCQDSSIDYNSSTTDFNVWKDI